MNGLELFTDPGYTALIESGDWEGLFSAISGEKNALVAPGLIVSTAVDAGNTPTTALRAGSILGITISTGKYSLYDATSTTGLNTARAVLPFQLPMQGNLGVVMDKTVPLLIRANLRVDQLHNADAQALRQLSQLGFLFDAPAGANALWGPAGTIFADGATVTAAQNGMLFQAAGAAAFTLPTIAAGLAYEFYQTADNDMTIASAGSADNIVGIHDAGGDLVTFGTSSQKIGSHARVVARYNAAGALRWYVSNLGGTTAALT